MPEIPDEAVQVVAERMFRRYESEYGASHLTWRDFADDARADLEAAAPVLAEAVAQKILAHMEAHDAALYPASSRRKDWRRHMDIAARIAARALGTRGGLTP